jgi:hypothetical protein
VDIYRNGDLEEYLFNNDQLGALSLGMAAYDGQIGMGSITLPGDPGWVAGDRVSVEDPPGTLLGTWYVMDRQRRRSASVDEVETTYQLMDLNRQLIGRKVTEWARNEETAFVRLSDWIGTFAPDLDLDLTWMGASTAIMPAKTYTGDGVMDLLRDLILYTGYTLFLAPNADETFDLHWHELHLGVPAGFAITDEFAAGTLATQVTFGGEEVVFVGQVVVYGVGIYSDIEILIRDPIANYSASDLKNHFDVRNGVDTVAGTNAPSIALHGAGGLKFQAVLDYGGVDQQTLVVFANTVLNTAGVVKPSYSCVIGPLTGVQVAAIPPGSRVPVTSQVLDLDTSIQRVSSIALTFSRDDFGNPLPGLYDAALELSFPIRQATAIAGYGAQGGDLGRLSPPLLWTDTEIAYDDPDIPVGVSTTVTAQLVDEDGVAIPVGDVPISWSIEQFSDEAETSPTTDYSLNFAVTNTDISGLATVVVTHDTDTGTVKWRVVGEP